MTRRTQYELNKAEERAHILQGLLIALDNIDEVIRIIRGSKNAQIAKEELDGEHLNLLKYRHRRLWTCVFVL